MSLDRSYLLDETVDAHLTSALHVEKDIGTPLERSPIPVGDADAKIGFRMPEQTAEVGSANPVQGASGPALPPMHAGPYMFLTPPREHIPAAETSSSIELTHFIPGASDGRLLVFIGTKGGSGVTTLACNFAVSLARESGKRILLIDLNFPLGDAAINLGITSQFSTMNAFQQVERLDGGFLSTLVERHNSGLYVLAAPSELAATEKVSREAIDKLLAVARFDYDYVVVDAGTSLEVRHLASFDQTAVVYLVTQIGVPELRNSNRLISKFPAHGGPNLEIVINRFDCRSQVIDDHHVTKALTRPALWKVPNDYAAVRRMQNTATHLMGEDSPISRTIRQMATRVCGLSDDSKRKKDIRFFGWRVSRA